MFFVYGHLKEWHRQLTTKIGRDILVHGEDSQALRYELSFIHFGTSTKVSRQFEFVKPVLKCLGSELSWIQSVRFTTTEVHNVLH